MLDPQSRELFGGANYAHVATIMPDGSPHCVPVWIDVEDDDRLVFYKEDSSIAIKNVRRDPRMAISIIDFEDPYRSAVVRGRVVDMRGEPVSGEWLRRRSVPYSGKPYPDPLPGPGTLLVVSPERVRYHSVDHFRHPSRPR